MDHFTVFAYVFDKHFQMFRSQMKEIHLIHSSVCENLHSLEFYRLCQIDDVQTAAEGSCEGFYKELRG